MSSFGAGGRAEARRRWDLGNSTPTAPEPRRWDLGNSTPNSTPTAPEPQPQWTIPSFGEWDDEPVPPRAEPTDWPERHKGLDEARRTARRRLGL